MGKELIRKLILGDGTEIDGGGCGLSNEGYLWCFVPGTDKKAIVAMFTDTAIRRIEYIIGNEKRQDRYVYTGADAVHMSMKDAKQVSVQLGGNILMTKTEINNRSDLDERTLGGDGSAELSGGNGAEHPE